MTDQDEPTSGAHRWNSRTSLTPLTPRQAKVAMLSGLMLLYPDQRLSADEWKIRLRAYLEEVEKFPPSMLEQAIRAGRKVWKFFPSVPEILDQVHVLQNQSAGTGGMGALGWPRYKAWLQWTGRPCFRPYTDTEMHRWMEKIPDSEMSRLGTPRT